MSDGWVTHINGKPLWFNGRGRVVGLQVIGVVWLLVAAGNLLLSRWVDAIGAFATGAVFLGLTSDLRRLHDVIADNAPREREGQ